MSSERERRFVGPRRGQFAFALGFLTIAAILLILIGDQTAWVNKTKLSAQPRFWPAVGLILMVVMVGLHLWKMPWRGLTRFDRVELRRWLTVFEFAGWFMVYVLVVPVLGYLPTTLIFVPALAWRMGYRSRRMMVICVAFSFAVV